MKTLIQNLAKAIWNMSEYYNIPLGCLAPWIFDIMCGSAPKKINKED